MLIPKSAELAVAVLALGLAQPAQAFSNNFTFNPAGIGLTGSAFSADALKATEVSHIVFTSPTDWVENGILEIIGAESGGSAVATPGLNEALTGGHGTYTLYAEFGGTGSMASNTFNTASITLWGVNGASTFYIDPITKAASVDNHGNTPIKLATSSLIAGTTGQNFISGGPPPVIDFFAQLLTTFTPEPGTQGFFAAPDIFFSAANPLKLFGDYFHDHSGVFFQPDGSVVLIGGDDTLTFVPEPASLALFFVGLSGLLESRRRLPGKARP